MVAVGTHWIECLVGLDQGATAVVSESLFGWWLTRSDDVVDVVVNVAAVVLSDAASEALLDHGESAPAQSPPSQTSVHRRCARMMCARKVYQVKSSAFRGGYRGLKHASVNAKNSFPGRP